MTFLNCFDRVENAKLRLAKILTILAKSNQPIIAMNPIKK